MFIEIRERTIWLIRKLTSIVGSTIVVRVHRERMTTVVDCSHDG